MWLHFTNTQRHIAKSKELNSVAIVSLLVLSFGTWSCRASGLDCNFDFVPHCPEHHSLSSHQTDVDFSEWAKNNFGVCPCGACTVLFERIFRNFGDMFPDFFLQEDMPVVWSEGDNDVCVWISKLESLAFQ